jgi:hypothetical protein
MTTAVQELLRNFENLSAPEQQQAASAILLRAAQLDSPALSDGELTALADEMFVELDQREIQS